MVIAVDLKLNSEIERFNVVEDIEQKVERHGLEHVAGASVQMSEHHIRGHNRTVYESILKWSNPFPLFRHNSQGQIYSGSKLAYHWDNNPSPVGMRGASCYRDSDQVIVVAEFYGEYSRVPSLAALRSGWTFEPKSGGMTTKEALTFICDPRSRWNHNPDGWIRPLGTWSIEEAHKIALAYVMEPIEQYHEATNSGRISLSNTVEQSLKQHKVALDLLELPAEVHENERVIRW